MSSANVIHCTDLFRPHDDFDDVGDAMAMFALHCKKEINLLAFVLDQPAEQERRPGRITVDELNSICGTNVPSVTGYHALLNVIQNAPTSVVVTIVGTCTDLYWAYRTNPGLCKSKIKEVWVFCGDAQENPPRKHSLGITPDTPYGLEHNVAGDPIAFREIMRSDLKIVWVPCYDGGEVTSHAVGVNQTHGSYWLGNYGQMLSKSISGVLEFFISALSEERGDGNHYNWNDIKHHHKEFFGVSLFKAISKPDSDYPFRFITSNIRVNNNATIKMGEGTKTVLIFEKIDKPNYYQRMTSIAAELFSNIAPVQSSPQPEPEPPEEEEKMKIVEIDLSWSSPLVPITNPIEKLIQHHMAHTTWTVFDVHNYHKNTNGWKGIGYNYWIAFDGTIYECRGRNVGAHAGANWNGRSLGIGYQGNFETQKMTDAQLKSGAWLNAKLIQEEGLKVDDIIGHKDATATLCPGKNFRMEELQAEVKKLLGGEAVGTLIIGEPQAVVEQAKAWALNRGVHQRFIDIAPVYWAYGKQTGIRPEILYAQSAKETAFGKYPGVVPPSHNNWAGIKTREAAGDRPEDHQQFPTPEEGVRAHFNHISAYVGLEPIGEPHGRYHLVKGLSWAGTVKTVEELGGKWAPSSDYGHSIIRDYLKDLLATEISDPVNPPDCPVCEELIEENNKLKNDLTRVSEALDQMEKRKNELEVGIEHSVEILNNLIKIH
ncbi:N-acetylmuramoyl-L-alanine amidase [Candidatus Contubernalis alkaliaceticus]|uniref:N-acetylmuramoyl-L-alanine amidase n=1 Tax=Candidatus Contubernalis alkaliaceticus TaxID=338645 RepID=UPI001F4C3DE5|nr:N-acetylmuramoyl-L-alanine amidase [Candidatus Contubernalis alkalaceticus]UNC90733.1 N-acetylmuramoyl-L-alanine amidase [Candidatus Contubernalis alkalaceticus]